MGKIVLYIATSIDGRIADANEGVEYLNDYMRPGEDYGYAEFLKRIGTVVMGAATYEKVLGFSYWYEGMDHVIFSSRELHIPEGRSVRQVSGNPTALAHELRNNEDMAGGRRGVAQQFLEHGLVDEMIITVVPKYLGSGTSLWQDGNPTETKWTLRECKNWEDGVVQLHYRPA